MARSPTSAAGSSGRVAVESCHARSCRGYAIGMSDRADAVARAVAAYATLGSLAEEVEDEWLYVNDLVTAYTASLESLAVGPELADEEVAAVDEAIAEIGLIEDPHRAIDWLSTFPHVVALAVGGDVDTAEPDGSNRSNELADGDSDDDDDNPFKALLRGGR